MNGGWAGRVLAVMLTMLVGWTAYENVQSMIFRNKGDRCTAGMCAQLDTRIMSNTQRMEFNAEMYLPILDELKIEVKRLQLQIDRLQGHDPLTYTEDHG